MEGKLYNMWGKSRQILSLISRTKLVQTSTRSEHTKMTSTANHKVNNLEKRFLVWTGKFKTVEEVPAYLQQNVVERARNRMRIRIANIMMGLTVVGCIVMVVLGKRAAGRGESISQQNLEWHRQYNEGQEKRAL